MDGKFGEILRCWKFRAEFLNFLWNLRIIKLYYEWKNYDCKIWRNSKLRNVSTISQKSQPCELSSSEICCDSQNSNMPSILTACLRQSQFNRLENSPSQTIKNMRMQHTSCVESFMASFRVGVSARMIKT